MSFDFGSPREAADPTSDFVSKFPSLDDADGADPTSATEATTGAGSHFGTAGGVPPSLDDFEDDLLGGGGASASSRPKEQVLEKDDDDEKPQDERAQFESQFPEFNDPDLGQSAPVEEQSSSFANGFSSSNDAATGSASYQKQQSSQQQQQSSMFVADPYSHDASDEEEPEPLRVWRHEQAESIARRSAEAERKKGEAVSQAERDIDQFYAEYNAKKEKSIKKNKEDEAKFADQRSRELAEGTTWDRICRLVDLQNSQSKTIAPSSAGSTDLARYRELLLSLRREGQTAPAAGGY